jgi:excisionase family DNA binding protein
MRTKSAYLGGQALSGGVTLREEVLINSKDAAAMLGISARTLERYIAEGQIPHIRLPQRGYRAPIRFSRMQLNKWLEQRTVRPARTARTGGDLSAAEVRQDEISRRIPA